MNLITTTALLAVAFITNANAAGSWGNHELRAGNQSMCRMGTDLDDERTIFVTFQPGQRLLLQVFRRHGGFGWGIATVTITFDDEPPQRGQGYAQGANIDFPIHFNYANDFVNAFADFGSLTITDGTSVWTAPTPGDGPVVDKFVQCIQSHGNIRRTQLDR